MRPAESTAAGLIYLNQSGFNINEPKRFTAPTLSDGTAFVVKEKNGSAILFSGTIQNQLGDFTAFDPVGDDEYIVEAAGEISVPFRIGPWWFERVTYHNAVDFMIDSRHYLGTYPGTCGNSFGWRDACHFAFEVNTLVAQYLSNPLAYERMDKEITYPTIPSPEPGSSAARYIQWGALEPYSEDAPDIVKMIHWGTDVIVSMDLRHEMLKEQAAYFLYAWPWLKQWLPQQNYQVVSDFAFANWPDPDIYRAYAYNGYRDDFPNGNSIPGGQHNLFEIKTKLGTTKGEMPPGHSVQPNLLMYEVAKRQGRADAEQYFNAAFRQAEWMIFHLDWENPQTTKGQRMSEHVTMTGMAHLMAHYPDRVPEGLEQKIVEWANVMIRRSDNLWDFRKLTDDGDWTPYSDYAGTMWNEPGNVVGFPACLLAAMQVIDDSQINDRLEQLVYSHIDNAFGRNPTGRHFSYHAPQEIEGVETGWFSFMSGGVGQLQGVRFVLEASPKREHYPYHPEVGNVGWSEGWVNFNTAFNVSLAYMAYHNTEVELTQAGDTITVRLYAPLNFDYTQDEPVSLWISSGNGDKEQVVLTETSPYSRDFSGTIQVETGGRNAGDGTLQVVENGYVEASYGLGYMKKTGCLGSLETPPLAHWEFDSDAADSVGGFHGTLQNEAAITNVPGEFEVGEGALSLDGVDDYVDVPTSAVSGLTEGTVSLWLKPASAAAGDLISLSDKDTSGNILSLSYLPSQKIAFEVKQNNSSLVNCQSPGGSVPVGQWTHVILTVDFGGNALYINGIQVSPGDYTYGSCSSDYFFDDVNNEDTFRIGSSNVGGFVYDTYFGGMIDDVHIYSRALSGAEIAVLAGISTDVPPPDQASNPGPFDGEVLVPQTARLSWIEGANTVSNHIYLGTNETAVNIADELSDEYMGSGTSPFAPGETTCYIHNFCVGCCIFAHGLLEEVTTYYWRIDESNPSGSTTKGVVWSFTTGYAPGSSLKPNLLGYYGFDEPDLADGDITTDFGNTPWSDGLVWGPATTVSDAGGNGKPASTVLDIVRGDYGGVFPLPVDKYNAGGSVSIAYWIKSRYADSSPYYVNNYKSYNMRQYGDPVRWSVYAKGVTATSTTAIRNQNEWYHVVGTYDAATGEGRLYVDGVREVTDPGSVGGLRRDITTFLHFGSTHADCGYSLPKTMDVQMDDIAVWDIALDDAAVLDIYQNGVPCGFAHKHSPANGQMVEPDTSTLSWKNASGATACDLWWYGTDPYNPSPIKVVDQQLVETASIPEALTYSNIYYWRVDTHVSPDLHIGRMVLMSVGNFRPEVDAGPDQQAYLAGSTVDIQLDGTVTDDGQPAPYTVLWTTISGPGGVIYTPSDTVEYPAATMTAVGVYTLELEADDGEKTGADTVEITVYADACVYAQTQGGFVWEPGDIDEDCDVDLDDFALMAADWLACYHIECL